jgi:chitin disaccharide deacetylase
MAARSVVIHADDLGMCRGANDAFVELSAFGTVTSGSVMVPCPWFPDLAAKACAAPTFDVGVHLTLTSEMPGYRWRPLTNPPKSAGLTDELGYLHRDVATLRRRAHPEAVVAELTAQIEAALAAGIDVTHLDDHMGAVLAPEFIGIYLDLAITFGLPPIICEAPSAYGGMHNLSGLAENAFAATAARARSAGFEVFARIAETDWTRTGPADAGARAMIDGLPQGLSFLALHVTKPGEIALIDPDTHWIRTDEYEVYRDHNFARWLKTADVAPLGMRELRDAWRARHVNGGKRGTA